MSFPDIYNPPISSYPSPLADYKGLPPLGEDRNEDGKSLKNPPAEKQSPAYDAFIDPLDKDLRGGFDVHIYYNQNNEAQVTYAKALWERIRREYSDAIVPELRIYRFWETPIGPHPIAMFEVNLFTPAQFGAFIPWLAIWRGPLSALVHPNTVEPEDGPTIKAEAGRPRGVTLAEVAVERRNHTQRAIWMGEKVPLDLSVFDRMAERAAQEA